MDGPTVQKDVAVRTCDANGRRSTERKRRAEDGDFQTRGTFSVSQQPIPQPKREAVHRTRGRDADVPVAESAGVVLYRGREPASQYSYAP